MISDSVRKTVPLTPELLAVLDAAATTGTTEHDVLVEIAGQGAGRSEASVLRALLELGASALEDRVAERGYVALAAAETEEDREFHAAMRRRVKRTGGDS
jgi:hypothetical protein